MAKTAYLLIQQAIRDGSLSQGSLYSENEVAESLGMSRTPVREALITLAREGIVEIASQRGFQIRRLTDAERQEIFDLRLLVEPYVARRLAPIATEDDVRRLSAVIDGQQRLSQAGEEAAFLALDEEFHLLMPQMVGLERSHGVMASLRGAMWLIGFEALAIPQRHSAVIAEHRAIVDAIANHDPDAAANATQDHIGKTATSSYLHRQ
ncbi:GntR family transcriptional regulator [Mycobacterium sp. M23085]|uniref:GntR family transcriptional regulator n=1 Tax=Mycobacterium sp. M23085 TaxID=3378087 RepID=UPI003877EC82